ncbi:protein FAM200C-like [Oratosquilla oratoria]|uniref:protein FAM200C-like n=1 Tax=Oratosquilla oratoria TaxID=337810 RepID=UPI003F76AFEE
MPIPTMQTSITSLSPMRSGGIDVNNTLGEVTLLLKVVITRRRIYQDSNTTEERQWEVKKEIGLAEKLGRETPLRKDRHFGALTSLVTAAATLVTDPQLWWPDTVHRFKISQRDYGNTLKSLEGSWDEEGLEPLPHTTTTKAQDVMGLINDFFEDSNFSWESLVGVCTDGALAMLGSRSWFVMLVKQKNPAVESTHCLIHKEVLASRTLPKNFKQHLETVINVVNFIKGSALNTRLFRRLCEGMEADHESLLFHTQVRWLSKRNMLQRVLELFDEVVAFLRAQENVVLLEALEGEFFRVRLSYLSDIFSALNELNRKLQGKGTNILFQSDKIRAFVAKLELWKKRAGSGSFSSFLALNECVEDMEDGLLDPIAEDIKQHLEGLEEEFNYYFPGIKNESNENKLIRDPFQRNVDDVPDAWQEEFLDLKNDSAAKDAF